MNEFISYPGSLHNHTDYSNLRLRDCINKLPRLLDTAKTLGHKVIAITDHETLSSYIDVEKIEKDFPDLKILRGNEIYLTRNDLSAENFHRGEDRYWHFILLCKDLEGYHQLCQLSTRAWKRSYVERKMRRVPTYYRDLKEIIGENKGHVIGSTACAGGFLAGLIISYKNTYDEDYLLTAKKWCEYMRSIFGEGNFYLEMQPSNSEEQIFINKQILDFSRELNIPYIITTDSHYPRPEDAQIHEAFLNAQEGDREVRKFYETTYLMNDEEIHNFFDYLSEEELQEAYSNILSIAEKCENFTIQKPLKIPSLPWREFPKYEEWELEEYFRLMPSLTNFYNSEFKADKVLVSAVIKGIKDKPNLQNQRAYDAIEECLKITWNSSLVNKAQWSAYFLNLQKVIDECWNAGTVVMPSRGSGGGFVLLYVLDIIQLNALEEKTKLYPWRFLNEKRVSVLDIDTDISGIKRAQVLDHLRNFYGEDYIVNVATFKLEKSKSAILTAARGLNIEVDSAKYISSLVTIERGQPYSLSQMYYGDEKEGIAPNSTFVTEINKYENLWEVARNIEGLVCGYSSHAGGLVLTDEPIVNTCALMRTPDGTLITQQELHSIEMMSLIKLDMLSVECADRIQTCLELLQKAGHIKKYPTLRETYTKALGLRTLERDSSEMWDMVKDHKIVNLFQMEQDSGIRGIALSNPRSVDDLAVLNSVIRLMAQEKGAETPLDKYARFRTNKFAFDEEMISAGLTDEEREILHQELDISSGLCITQEQFMKLVQLPECGGWDLQFADGLRKAIAKKNPKAFNEIEKQFFERVNENHLSENFCKYVWYSQISLSKGYGFKLMDPVC